VQIGGPWLGQCLFYLCNQASFFKKDISKSGKGQLCFSFHLSS
jgi:hypothetical protein